MSRESLARATNSTNLELESGVVHDADRLAAAAGGDTLGGLLLRVTDSAQPRWLKQIMLILARRVMDKHDLPRPVSHRIAMTALDEFRDPHCGTCKGARVMIIDQLKIVCAACEGSGKERFTNGSRRARIGTYGRRIDEAVSDCHRWMQDALSAYLSAAAARLA